MNNSIISVFYIRAIASLMVCLFHLSCGNAIFFNPEDNIFKVFDRGYLGVEMFFILSGFIIAYAFPKNATLQNCLLFIKKRLIRIEPPYIISILLVLVLNYISYKITGKGDMHISLENFAYHLAYLNNFNLGDYFSPVYWTLGIEFQFYLIAACIFPLIKTNKQIFTFSFIGIAVTLIPFPNNISIILPYFSYFLLGYIFYQYKFSKILNKTSYITLTALCILSISYNFSVDHVIISILTLAILNYCTIENRIIKFLSNLSFSLYLTHVIVGGKVINLGLRFIETDFQKYMLWILAIVASITFAHLFYIVIEKPAIRWSKKIKYHVQ